MKIRIPISLYRQEQWDDEGSRRSCGLGTVEMVRHSVGSYPFAEVVDVAALRRCLDRRAGAWSESPANVRRDAVKLLKVLGSRA